MRKGRLIWNLDAEHLAPCCQAPSLFRDIELGRIGSVVDYTTKCVEDGDVTLAFAP